MKKTFFRHYGSTLQEQARDLRKNMTGPERKLWFCFLKDLKPKFSCQKVIGPYIVDFFCPQLQLAIELDGESHTEAVEHDRLRTEYLKEQQIKVLRFTNQDVRKRFRDVCEAILQEFSLVPPARGLSAKLTEGCAEMQFCRQNRTGMTNPNPRPFWPPPCKGGTRNFLWKGQP